MIVPYRDENGKRNGFLAGGAVFNLNGRKLGQLVGHQVYDQKGISVAEVDGDQLVVIKPLPWAARTIDGIRTTLRHLGISRLNEVPD